jgi:hypothetical protein
MAESAEKNMLPPPFRGTITHHFTHQNLPIMKASQYFISTLKEAPAEASCQVTN